MSKMGEIYQAAVDREAQKKAEQEEAARLAAMRSRAIYEQEEIELARLKAKEEQIKAYYHDPLHAQLTTSGIVSPFAEFHSIVRNNPERIGYPDLTGRDHGWWAGKLTASRAWIGDFVNFDRTSLAVSPVLALAYREINETETDEERVPYEDDSGRVTLVRNTIYTPIYQAILFKLTGDPKTYFTSGREALIARDFPHKVYVPKMKFLFFTTNGWRYVNEQYGYHGLNPNKDHSVIDASVEFDLERYGDYYRKRVEEELAALLKDRLH